MTRAAAATGHGSLSGVDGALIRHLQDRIATLLQRAAPLCARHRAELPDPVIRYDLSGQAAGQAQWWQHRRPVLRFNLALARRHPTDFLATTVAHEVAHLITRACFGRTRPHGPEWRAVMTYLGIPNPRRCHDYVLDERQIRRQRRWVYRCDCRTHLLSTTRHNRALAGKTGYQCRQCGTRLHPLPQAEA